MKLSCKLCGTKTNGGFYRLKYHLTIITGHNVIGCDKASLKVIQAAHEALCKLDRKKAETVTEKLEISAGGIAISSKTTGVSGIGDSERDSTGSASMRTSPFFVLRTRRVTTPLDQWLKERTKTGFWRGFLFGEIPLTIAKTNLFYQGMFDVATILGPGIKPLPTRSCKGHSFNRKKLI